ncbi:MAG: hypothetical protein QXP98_07080 [Thermoproteus sp.]
MIVRIYPLGPYRAGARQVSGVEDIGADAAFYLPPPTTAVGAYATALGATSAVDAASGLGCEAVWGPLVEVRGRLHFAADRWLFPLERLGDYIKAAVDGAEPPKPAYRFEEVEKPGVALADKSVQHLYYAKFVWLREEGGGRAVMPGELAFVYYVKCASAKPVAAAAVSFGGEGRPARLEASGERPDAMRPARLGVLLSPLLFRAEGPWAEVGRDRGLEDVEEVFGVYDGSRFKVRSGYYGLGYSVSLKRRRALMQGLPPGTVVRLKGESTHAGLYRRWGFGSLLGL